MRDVALTRDEIDGLMAGLLTSDRCADRLHAAERLAGQSNAGVLGRRYVSELRRNFPP